MGTQLISAFSQCTVGQEVAPRSLLSALKAKSSREFITAMCFLALLQPLSQPVLETGLCSGCCRCCRADPRLAGMVPRRWASCWENEALSSVKGDLLSSDLKGDSLHLSSGIYRADFCAWVSHCCRLFQWMQRNGHFSERISWSALDTFHMSCCLRVTLFLPQLYRVPEWLDISKKIW